MCDFCENIQTIDFSEETSKTLCSGISIDKQTGEYFIVSDFRLYEYGLIDSLKIHYCPICGRKLDEEKELPWVTVGMEDDCK